MATVLRVKRRFDHEPLDALVIAGKRRKVESDLSDEVKPLVPLTAVVKFAGTVKNQEDDVVEHLNKTLTKEELKANFKQHTVDILNKARAKNKQDSRDNRYKVVNYFRSNNAQTSKDQGESSMTVIDVEHSKPSAVVKTPVLDDTEIGYVWDLYYSHVEDELFHNLDDELTISPLEQELVFDSYEENGTRPEDDCPSEDSNSESNYKNDYPDSDHSENSVDDDNMREAVRRLKMNDESSDLSSEEDFVYAADEADVESYGYDYVKYKARVKEELDESDSSGDSSKSDYSLAEESCDHEDKHESEEN